MLTLDSHIRIPKHVTSTFVEEDAVLLNMRTNQYFALQEVSSRLWTLLKDGKTLHEAFDALAVEYEIATDILANDVLEFIQQMLENGLVELVEK